MQLNININDYGIGIGSADDKTYTDNDSGDTVTIEQQIIHQGFSYSSYASKNDYADAIEDYLLSIGIESAEAKSIAKLAKDIAKDNI